MFRFLALLLMSQLISGVSGLAATSGSPPNIVLVMADDQGWGDAAYQGHPHLITPELDRMAAEGLVFDRFYAAASVCSPTRGSVMTGRHPNRFGCFSWGYSLWPEEQSLAELMRSAGYRTGHFGKWHLGSVQAGSPVNPGAHGFDRWVSAPNFFDNDPILSDQGRAIQTQGESSMVTAEKALDFIDHCARNQERFFSVVWFGSPHLPHKAADVDRAHYASLPVEQQNFYGEITGMDCAIGHLRRGLESRQLAKNTLVWYCSDNGALPRVGSSGQFRGHKAQVYEGGLLVPCILLWPDVISQNRRVSGRGSTCDIFPTLAEIAGVESLVRHPLDGISLAHVIRGEKFENRPGPMGFWNFPSPGISTPSRVWMRDLLTAQNAGYEPLQPDRLRPDARYIQNLHDEDFQSGHSAWIHGSWKLHRIQPPQSDSITWEIYDLENDPKEIHNLIDSVPDPLLTRLKTELKNWQASVIHSVNKNDYLIHSGKPSD